MGRIKPAVLSLLVALAFVGSACGAPSSATDVASDEAPEKRTAFSTLAAFRYPAARGQQEGPLIFGFTQPLAPTSPGLLDVPRLGRRVVEAARGVKVRPRAGGGFDITHPPIARASTSKLARTELPERLSDGFRVAALDGSGLEVQVRYRGATSARGEVHEGGLVVYEHGAGDGMHVAHRPHAEGTEDYIVIPAGSGAREVVYDIDVTKVAGLRLVSNVLEFLDLGGTPRARLVVPGVYDESGRNLGATVEVRDCAYDDSAAPPWDRRPVPPGRASCGVSVRFPKPNGPSSVLVDPSWVSTGSLVKARAQHSVAALSDGSAAIVGGLCNGGSDCSLTEIWKNGAFAASWSIAHARRGTGVTKLADDRVLIAGGFTSDQSICSGYNCADIDIWSPGGISSGGALSLARSEVHAALLSDGSVLLVGGYRTANAACPGGQCPRVERWVGSAGIPG